MIVIQLCIQYAEMASTNTLFFWFLITWRFAVPGRLNLLILWVYSTGLFGFLLPEVLVLINLQLWEVEWIERGLYMRSVNGSCVLFPDCMECYGCLEQKCRLLKQTTWEMWL